jgi:hypothetical protein
MHPLPHVPELNDWLLIPNFIAHLPNSRQISPTSPQVAEGLQAQGMD